MDMSQWFGAVAPAGAPDQVVMRLANAMNKALADEKIKALTDGKAVRKVIVVPRKLVNIVVAG